MSVRLDPVREAEKSIAPWDVYPSSVPLVRPLSCANGWRMRVPPFREDLIPVFDEVATRNPGEIEFRQSVCEVLKRFLGRRSEARVMRFCQSLMTELYRHLGSYDDVLAGDIGVGVGDSKIADLFGQRKRINVAVDAIKKIHQLRGRVIVYSDPSSYIIDEAGIGIKLPNEMKNGHPIASGGANLPISLDGPRVLREVGVRFAPGNAANAGGVAASALEMQPNASRDHWTFELTKERLPRSCAPNATTASRRPGNTMRRTASSPGSPSPTTPRSRTLRSPSDSSRGQGGRQ